MTTIPAVTEDSKTCFEEIIGKTLGVILIINACFSKSRQLLVFRQYSRLGITTSTQLLVLGKQ